jgi:hypothetical protein
MASGGWDRASESTSMRLWLQRCSLKLQRNRAAWRTSLTCCSELAREKMWARIYLIPALQAEEDRDQVRRYLADKAREKELLGSETRIYNSDRCVTRTSRQGTTNNHSQVRPANLCCHTGERDEIRTGNWSSARLCGWGVYTRWQEEVISRLIVNQRTVNIAHQFLHP